MKALRKTPASTLGDVLPLKPFTKSPEPFYSSNVVYTMNGRNAIYHALKYFRIKHNSTVLLPAYHCTALVDPVIAFGANIKFYNVKKDLSINMSEIESLIDKNVSCLLFIHFFGFPAPAKQFADLGEKYSITIIEDCTHTLFGMIGNRYVGKFGDAAIFSFRKILSTKDGGALIINRESSEGINVLKNAPLLYQLRIAKWTFENPDWERIKTDKESSSKINFTIPDTPDKSITNSKKGPASQEDPNFFLEYADWPISMISKWIFKQTNARNIYERRRANYGYLDARLKKIDKIMPCFSHLADGVCPMAYPFIFEHSSRLDYFLRVRGIPAFSFGEELYPGIDQHKYRDAHFLSKYLVLLPVHQKLEKYQIDRMCEILEECLSDII